MTIDLPACSIAIKNTGPVTLYMSYAGKVEAYQKADPKNGSSPTIISFEVAHKHFGFEFTPDGKLYRNTKDKYEDGDETAYYVARATYLPWGWQHDERPYNPRDPKDKQVSKQDMFEAILHTWEDCIEGRLLTLPKQISIQQFEALPA